jgi:hypothetical protein
MITEEPPSITIQVMTTGQTILISPAGIQILSGESVINLGPPESPPNAQIVSGDNAISLTPDGIAIASAGTLKIASSGPLNLVGSVVNITGGMVNIN